MIKEIKERLEKEFQAGYRSTIDRDVADLIHNLNTDNYGNVDKDREVLDKMVYSLLRVRDKIDDFLTHGLDEMGIDTDVPYSVANRNVNQVFFGLQEVLELATNTTKAYNHEVKLPAMDRLYKLEYEQSLAQPPQNSVDFTGEDSNMSSNSFSNDLTE